ncbi:hypothetical protein MY10362_005990 [Beauveria mimosiformis]
MMIGTTIDAAGPQCIGAAPTGDHGLPVLRAKPVTRAPVCPPDISSKNFKPVMDTDGKFPYPRCDKTYLRAKHLKRHLLCHTGVRPYMCDFCCKTFSRSNTLKQHV